MLRAKMFRVGTRLRAFQKPPFQTIRRPPTQVRAYRQPKLPNKRPQYRRFDDKTHGGAAPKLSEKHWGFILVGLGGIYVYNIEEVPISGRRRFNVIPRSFEEWMARSTAEAIYDVYEDQILDDDDPRTVKVKEVLDRLLPCAERAGLKDVEWELTVIDDPEQNAFVVPGGKVFFFTGLLPLCEDEDGVAAVLGHEIAHIVASHSAENMSKQPFMLLGMAILSSLDPTEFFSRWLIDVFFSRPASRKHETEADYIGLMMMAQGCYKPESAMEFWARMEKQGDDSPPQILSTHPSHVNRGKKIREWLPEAQRKAYWSECNVVVKHVPEFKATVKNYDDPFERFF